ncbi:histone H3.2, partial [Tanacetum coccineum]
EIRKYQKSTKLLIRKLPFQRLVHEDDDGFWFVDGISALDGSGIDDLMGLEIPMDGLEYDINVQYSALSLLHDIIPKIASNATNDIIEDNLPKVLVEAVIKKETRFKRLYQP